MPVPTRPTKGSTGTTSYAADTIIYAAELEDESVALFGGFANLDDANIAAAANIDPSKIGDYSATDAEQKTVTNPGSGSSLSAPTTLEGELATLRYVVERLATGLDGTTHAKRKNATANVDVSWADGPARPENLATNGSFEVKQSATAADPPDQWATVGTLTSATLAATDASEGAGRMVTITTAATNSGISQTFTKLRASTRYIIAVRAKYTSGTGARLVTVGASATSVFRDITLDTTSATFTTLSAVVETDATPTALVVRLLGIDSGDVVSFDHFSIQECSALLSPIPTEFSAVSVVTTELSLPDGVATDSGLSCVVVPPLPGYQIAVRAKINLFASGGGATKVAVQLKENGTEKDISYWSAPASHSGTAVVEYINQSPTPGDTYTYTVVITPTSYNQQMNRAALGNQRSVLTATVRR